MPWRSYWGLIWKNGSNDYPLVIPVTCIKTNIYDISLFRISANQHILCTEIGYIGNIGCLSICYYFATVHIRNYSRLIHSFLNDANHLEIKCNQTCQECYFCVPVVHSENEMATTTRHRLTLEPLWWNDWKSYSMILLQCTWSDRTPPQIVNKL